MPYPIALSAAWIAETAARLRNQTTLMTINGIRTLQHNPGYNSAKAISRIRRHLPAAGRDAARQGGLVSQRRKARGLKCRATLALRECGQTGLSGCERGTLATHHEDQDLCVRQSGRCTAVRRPGPGVAGGRAPRHRAGGLRLAGLVRGHGLDFIATRESLEAFAQQLQVEGGNMVKILAAQAKAAQELARRAAAAGLAACHNANLILGGLGGIFTGAAIAEKLDYPVHRSLSLPVCADARVSQRPHAAAADAAHFLGQRPHAPAGPADDVAKLPGPDNKARTEVLRMQRRVAVGAVRLAGAAQPARALWLQSRRCCLHPRIGTHAAMSRATGFSIHGADWQPPPDLLDFLARGPPPVYIGFGSMASSKPRDGRHGPGGAAATGSAACCTPAGAACTRKTCRTTCSWSARPRTAGFSRVWLPSSITGAPAPGGGAGGGCPVGGHALLCRPALLGAASIQLGAGPKPVPAPQAHGGEPGSVDRGGGCGRCHAQAGRCPRRTHSGRRRCGSGGGADRANGKMMG